MTDADNINTRRAWQVDLESDYQVSTDRELLDEAAVADFLANDSYWAQGRPSETIVTSIANSLCFGLYDSSGTQAGFTRVVGDSATFGWVCDVFVLPDHRGRGLGKAMLEAVLSHPDVAATRRLMLATADAHELYAKFGFTELVEPGRWMERRAPGFDLPPMS